MYDGLYEGDEELYFFDFTEAELNAVDSHGRTPLFSAVCRQESLE